MISSMPPGQHVAELVQLRVDRVPVGQHGVEHCLGGRHDDGIAREHAAVEQRAANDQVHDLGRRAKAADRIAAAQRLRNDRDVGRDEVVLLSAAGGDAHAGDDFIEDQQALMVERQFADGLQIAIAR